MAVVKPLLIFLIGVFVGVLYVDVRRDLVASLPSDTTLLARQYAFYLPAEGTAELPDQVWKGGMLLLFVLMLAFSINHVRTENTVNSLMQIFCISAVGLLFIFILEPSRVALLEEKNVLTPRMIRTSTSLLFGHCVGIAFLLVAYLSVVLQSQATPYERFPMHRARTRDR